MSTIPMSRARRALGALSGQSVLVGAVLWTTLVLIAFPLLFVVWRSVSTTEIGSPLTFEWYQDMATNRRAHEAIANTLILTLGSVVLALPIGLMLAFLIARTDIPGATAFGSVALLPFLMPPFISVVGWIVLASPQVGVVNVALRALVGSDAGSGPFDIYTMGGMIWTSALYLTPYVYLTTVGAFARLDPAMEEAARTGGGGRLVVLRRITLPVIAPAILAAALLGAVIAAGQFVIPLVIGTTARIEVLSTVIYKSMNLFPPNAQLAAAEGFLVASFGLALLFAQQRVLRGSYATVTGRGFRSERIGLGRWRYPALVLSLAYIACAIALPLVAILALSIVRFWTTPITASQVTLDNYRYILFEFPAVWSTVGNTILLAVATAVLGVSISLVIAWAVVRTRSNLSTLLSYVTIVPLGVPATVMALGVLQAWINPPIVLYGTGAILIAGYLAVHLPAAVQILTAAVRQVSPELEESSRSAGGSWLGTVTRITFPLLRDSAIGAWLILYVLSLRDLSVSILLYSPKTTVMAIGLYDMWSAGSHTRLAAYSVLFLVIGYAPFLLWRLSGRWRSAYASSVSA